MVLHDVTYTTGWRGSTQGTVGKVILLNFTGVEKKTYSHLNCFMVLTKIKEIFGFIYLITDSLSSSQNFLIICPFIVLNTGWWLPPGGCLASL